MTTRNQALAGMSREIKEDIYKAYKHGGEFKEIARSYKLSYPFLAGILLEIGGKDFKIENNLLPPLADIQNPSLKNLYKMSIIPPGTVAKKNKGFSKLTDEEIEIYKRLSLVDLSEIVDTEDGWLKEVKKISQSIKKESLKGKLELLTNQIKKAEEGKKEKELDVLKKRFRDLSLELANI